MRRRRVIGTVTSYPAFDAFRDYLYGQGTLAAFRKAPRSVTELIYADEPELPTRYGWIAPFVVGFIVGGVIVGAAVACTL